jgi:hypothetical protein
MKTKKRLEDYSWEELLEATSGKEGMREAGRDSGQFTLDNKIGIHTDDEELRKYWASMGGEASIEKLLEWQKENNHNIGEIAKVKDDEWKIKIGKGNKGKIRTEELKNRLSEILVEKNSKLSEDERKEKYSNDSSSNKSLRVRLEVLSLIESNRFNTAEARRACDKYGLGNWKGLLKDERVVKQIHKGTNNFNPSIYEKINQ